MYGTLDFVVRVNMYGTLDFVVSDVTYNESEL